jgi:hypothetical protein
MLMDVNLNIVILARDARSFYDSYEVLKEKNAGLFASPSNKMNAHQKKSKDIDVSVPLTEHNIDFTTPSLVCLAFSIELHLKLLLRTYDIVGRGHDIDNLIKKLPKDEIAHISTHADFHPTQQGEKFFENITKASKLFTRTRYYFETLEALHFNTGFCATLGKVIRKRIVNRVPYLTYDLGAFSE